MKAIVSEKGQLTIPKSVRQKLGIRPGTVLEVEAVEGKLVAVKKSSADGFVKWRGRGRLPGGLRVDEYLEKARG
jgi:AbrB family looped-hinge helix DNA binding protein